MSPTNPNTSRNITFGIMALVLAVALFIISITPETDTYNPLKAFLDYVANFDQFLAAVPQAGFGAFILLAVIQVLKKAIEHLSFVPDRVKNWDTLHIKMVVVFTYFVVLFFVQEYSLFEQFEFYWPSIEQIAVKLFQMVAAGAAASQIYEFGKARDEPWATARKEPATTEAAA